MTFELPTATRYDVTRADERFVRATFPDVAGAAQYAAEAIAEAGQDYTIRVIEEPQGLAIDPDDGNVPDRVRIRQAFARLRKTHVTSMGRVCCSSCMWGEVAERREATGRGLLGFNHQSWSSFDDERLWLTSTLYLQHAGDTALAVETLRDQGLAAEWDGTEEQAVQVHPSSVEFCPRTHGDTGYCGRCRRVARMKDRAALADA